MPEIAIRSAAAALTLGGAGTLYLAAQATGEGDLPALYLQLITGATGVALLASVWIRALRLPAVAFALACKLSYLLAWSAAQAQPAPAIAEALLLVVLACAGGVLLFEARREARWNGGQSFRLES
ncbi:hypothetical protein EZ313_07820 [Ramlibacter henchirensis]|uniref:Uncharacterized protein n=1 Tax=Ramlibacter henchirensis TaxID=204072 RepID=A0A4Z0C5H5_9BURK|nr:hypothetical protein [Ramlibacter henchirensis]TFZ06531.1 hypothetical protein EZ313_07820 [Ramlibacter henchirensis]